MSASIKIVCVLERGLAWKTVQLDQGNLVSSFDANAQLSAAITSRGICCRFVA